MIDFYELTERCVSSFKKTVNDKVFGNNEINFIELERLASIKKKEFMNEESLKNMPMLHYYDIYLEKRDVLESIYYVDLHHFGDEDCMTAAGVKTNKLIWEMDDWEVYTDFIQNGGLNHEIIDNKKYEIFTKKVYYDFARLIIEKNKIQIINNAFDKATNKGEFAKIEVQKILARHPIKKHINYELAMAGFESAINDDSKEKKRTDNVPDVLPKYTTFYSPTLKSAHSSSENLMNVIKLFDFVFNKMCKAGILDGKRNNSKQLMELFINKSISLNRILIWTGSIYDLNKLGRLISIDNVICNHLGGLNTWYVLQKCFHCKVKGKNMGVISDYKTIAYSKKSKGDKSKELDEIVKVIREFCSSSLTPSQ
ncbi:MAG: hypothetical protein HRT71_12525 [Flavobacteriales bacterium]|nr:hypothetical protein [Flavobacteriales bacterium]